MLISDLVGGQIIELFEFIVVAIQSHIPPIQRQNTFSRDADFRVLPGVSMHF